MNLSEPKKKHVPMSVNVPHPDLSIVRKNRIEKLVFLVNKALEEKNAGLEKKWKKEIEIQTAYMMLEAVA